MFTQISARIFRWLAHFLVGGLCISLLSCTQSNQLSKQEKALLLTERNFSAFFPNLGKRKLGHFNKEKSYLDGITTLEYEVTVSEQLYLMNTVSLCKGKSDAIQTAFALRTGALIGVKMGDITSEEIALPEHLDDKLTLLLLKIKDAPVGNVWTYVHDNKIWFVILTGIYYENAQDFQQAYQSHLLKIQTYQKP